MKSLVAGIIGVGLTVWPIALVQWVWHLQRTNIHATAFPWNSVVPLMIISSLAGFIAAICGTMIADDEDVSTLRFFGRGLCVITFCIEGAVLIWIISGFAQFSKFGVN
jgi:hypothetical protein